MPSTNEVKGKVAIVTGAASGIGRAITELLVARGARVIAEDIDPAVEALASPNVVPFVADVSADGSAETAVKFAFDRFAGLDILVNNAGIIVNKLLVEMSRHEWSES
jgi:NAD(P)-dependent dehydrogenase (short-subunit alcohol dehydrogenase family)